MLALFGFDSSQSVLRLRHPGLRLRQFAAASRQNLDSHRQFVNQSSQFHDVLVIHIVQARLLDPLQICTASVIDRGIHDGAELVFQSACLLLTGVHLMP